MSPAAYLRRCLCSHFEEELLYRCRGRFLRAAELLDHAPGHLVPSGRGPQVRHLVGVRQELPGIIYRPNIHRGATITSDAGLLAARELDEALGLTEMTPSQLEESRTGRKVQHPLVPLLRQSVYSRLAGYEDTNDAEWLAQDLGSRLFLAETAIHGIIVPVSAATTTYLELSGRPRPHRTGRGESREVKGLGPRSASSVIAVSVDPCSRAACPWP